MTEYDESARWAKEVTAAAEKRTLDVIGGPQEMDVVTLTVRAMGPTATLLDTGFAAQTDELRFALPAALLTPLIQQLVTVQRSIRSA